MKYAQSRFGSLLEALANIAVGMGTAFTSQLIIFAFYGISVDWTINLKMTGWFTLISLVRSFCLRRLFNYLTFRREIRAEAREWAKPPASLLAAASREFEKRQLEGKL